MQPEVRRHGHVIDKGLEELGLDSEGVALTAERTASFLAGAGHSSSTVSKAKLQCVRASCSDFSRLATGSSYVQGNP